MLELLPKSFLTEQQMRDLAATEAIPPVPPTLPSESAQAPKFMTQQAVHWTKRFRDPLGEALTRISLAKNSPNGIDTTVALQQQMAESEEAAESDASILPLPPVTLPMFDTAQDSAVHTGLHGESDNRRRFPRRHSECRVAIVQRVETLELTPRETDWLLESGRSVGRLQDLSQLGICLLLDREIPAGTEVLLRIANEQIQRSVDMSARVVRCQPARPGTYSIHCQTLREFTLDELQDLGQPILSPRVFA